MKAQSIFVAGVFTIEGEDHLSDLDDARRDWVIRALAGLGEMPGSRRMVISRVVSGVGLGRISRVDAVLAGSVSAMVAVVVSR